MRKSTWVASHKVSRAPGILQLSSGRDHEQSGKTKELENLWQNFFSKPSEWLDNRSEKVNPRFPDFKHKHSRKGLWVDGRWNPPWVASKMASISPGLLQIGAVSWTQKLSQYNKSKQYDNSLMLFKTMQQEGIYLDHFVFVPVLNACAGLQALEEGKRIHKLIIETGFELDLYVCSSLVDMYIKCGNIDDASEVFNKMPSRDLVVWNLMIFGYVKFRKGWKAIELFHQMKQNRVEPNSVTFVTLLNACASEAALGQGRYVHAEIKQRRFESDAFVVSSLVDMYAKCGSIKDAWMVFTQIPIRTTVDYTAMIGGFAMHGHAKQAIGLFEQMLLEDLETDEVTFVCLLRACSHGGFVKEGIEYFHSMRSYGVSATIEHYTCMVDLLGRAGRLDDAEKMINSMPVQPDATIWRCLLGASRIHGNVEIGERAAKHVLELDPEDSAGYVLLANLYAATGFWEGREMAHQQRLARGARKLAGHARIEVRNELHSFSSNDCKHPQIKEVHAELLRLSKQMKEAGYIPDTRFALHDEEEGERTDHLSHHSEKLAIAFGLISTPVGAPLLILKNLRVCGDCHDATKFISKIVGREISVRDCSRFHLFKDGYCSCYDYW